MPNLVFGDKGKPYFCDEKDVHFRPQSGVIEMRENIGKEAWKDGQKPENGVAYPIGTKQMHPTLGTVGDAIGR